MYRNPSRFNLALILGAFALVMILLGSCVADSSTSGATFETPAIDDALVFRIVREPFPDMGPAIATHMSESQIIQVWRVSSTGSERLDKNDSAWNLAEEPTFCPHVLRDIVQFSLAWKTPIRATVVLTRYESYNYSCCTHHAELQIARQNNQWKVISRQQSEPWCAKWDPPAPRDPASTQTPSSYMHFTQGAAYLAAAQYKLAIEEFSQAAELDPNDADVYTYRGWAYAKLGEYERAVADYRRAIALNPDLPDPHNNLAWTLAYYLNTDYQEALQHALLAVELEPSVYTHDTLALVNYKLQRHQAALEHYNTALSLDPDHVSSYKGRGDVYLALGNREAAIQDYQNYLARVPGGPERDEVERMLQSL